MSLKTHTSGPWQTGYGKTLVENSGHSVESFFIEQKGSNRLLALIASQYQSESDAKLMAAAPELLEAVAFCQVMIEGYEQGACDVASMRETCLEKTRAAIAKATGGEAA